MNHLLISAEILSESGEFWVRGEQAEHLRRVLKVVPGQTVRAARLNMERGIAEILEVSADAVRARYHEGEPVARPAAKTLLLAIPRPKVLSRCVQHAAALGYQSIYLFRCYRVEKAHLESGKLDPLHLTRDAVLGLEQARLVHLPEIRVFTRFKPFVEDVLPTHEPTSTRYVGHPAAVAQTHALARAKQSYCLAVGPEGGFIDYELELLLTQGFQGISAGSNPLRVESALSYLTGQLDLIHG